MPALSQENEAERPRQRPDALRRHQVAEARCTGVQDVFGKDRQQGQRAKACHAEQGYHGHQPQDGAFPQQIAQALFEVAEGVFGAGFQHRRGQAHEQQRDDDGEEGDGVDGKGRGFP